MNEAVQIDTGREYWWHGLMEMASVDCAVAPMDSEAPLKIVYLSGSTGESEGIKHTSAGYLF